jgi:hypothetical protein
MPDELDSQPGYQQSTGKGVLWGLLLFAAACAICLVIAFIAVALSERPQGSEMEWLFRVVQFTPVVLLLGALAFYLRQEKTAFRAGVLIALSAGLLLSSTCTAFFVAKSMD